MIVQINSISSETPTSDYIMVKDGQPEAQQKSFGSRVLNPGFSLEPSEPPSETNHCSFSTGHCSFCRFSVENRVLNIGATESHETKTIAFVSTNAEE